MILLRGPLYYPSTPLTQRTRAYSPPARIESSSLLGLFKELHAHTTPGIGMLLVCVCACVCVCALVRTENSKSIKPAMSSC